MGLQVGIIAPNFTLPDQEGTMHALSDSLGKWVLVYFYPKDDTSGCTKEACAFRDMQEEFDKLNTRVFGISADSLESHNKFHKKYHLPFPLLSDPEKKVIKTYGALKKGSAKGKQGVSRMSYLIDPMGKIIKVYKKVNPEIHTGEVLRDIYLLT